MKCDYKLCNNEVIGYKNKKFCSKNCYLKYRLIKRRREVKIKAVEMMGGSCIRCGYNRCLRALQFHHIDPSQKRFSISTCDTIAWIRIEEELKKCILLCSNCHAEEEDAKIGR